VLAVVDAIGRAALDAFSAANRLPLRRKTLYMPRMTMIEAYDGIRRRRLTAGGRDCI
jgi:hypothetical protein